MVCWVTACQISHFKDTRGQTEGNLRGWGKALVPGTGNGEKWERQAWSRQQPEALPAAEAAEQVGGAGEVTNPWDSWRDRKGPPKLSSSQRAPGAIRNSHEAGT